MIGKTLHRAAAKSIVRALKRVTGFFLCYRGIKLRQSSKSPRRAPSFKISPHNLGLLLPELSSNIGSTLLLPINCLFSAKKCLVFIMLKHSRWQGRYIAPG